LRITGYKDHLFGTGYYYIDATLLSVEPKIGHKITFMVDTGCQVTTISLKDSLPFRGSVPPPTSFTLTANGHIDTSVIFNCALSFNLVQSIHMEKLNKINILNPQITLENVRNMLSIPSTLGVDILSRYYLSFDTSSVTLEK
jgi:hypothetical protein